MFRASLEGPDLEHELALPNSSIDPAAVLLAAGLASLVAYVATPLTVPLARKGGVLDRPGGRRTHDGVVPRLGGLAVGFAFGFVLLGLLAANRAGLLAIPVGTVEVLQIALLVGGMTALGVLDDLLGLAARWKLLGQTAIVLGAWGAGFGVRGIGLPFVGPVDLGDLALPVTLLWYLGVTNALNLVDGIDGLGAGVAFLAASASAIVAAYGGAGDTALLFAVVAGASVGFLPHNRPPARVFLGDGGALGLGFAIALVSARGAHKTATAFSLLAPALALGLPLGDTLFAFARRVAQHVRSRAPRVRFPIFSALRAAATPDADHIHHRLLRAGFSRRQAVVLLYVACAALGLAAFASTVADDAGQGLVLGYTAGVSVLGIRILSRTAGARGTFSALVGGRDRSLLVVHGDSHVVAVVRGEALALGLKTAEVSSVDEAIHLAPGRSFDVVVAPSGPLGGVAGLARLRGVFPHAVPVAVAGFEDLEAGLDSLRRDAYDLVELPPSPGRTRLVLVRALERASLSARFRTTASLLWMLVFAAPILAYLAAALRPA